MTTLIRNTIAILMIVLLVAFCFGQDRHPAAILEGPYMGQAPPGDEPQVFAQSFLGADFHSCPVFTPDGTEAYWSAMTTMKMMFSKIVDGNWTIPEEYSLSLEHSMSDSPSLSTDGNILYFVSTAPISEDRTAKESIWYMDRVGDAWSSPQPLSNTVNQNQMHWQLSVAENGNLYISYLGPTGVDIGLLRFIDDQYTEIEILGPEINKPDMAMEYAPFIAPDESYLIFSFIDDASGNPYSDLFISFKNPDSSWTEAVPMDGLNSDGKQDMCANVTRDGQYLFFLKDLDGGGIAPHWVSADVINDYRTILCGDANLDETLNVGDAVYLINYVFKSGPAPDPLCLGDSNGDSSVNVGDAVHMINFVFKSGDPPIDPCCQ